MRVARANTQAQASVRFRSNSDKSVIDELFYRRAFRIFGLALVQQLEYIIPNKHSSRFNFTFLCRTNTKPSSDWKFTRNFSRKARFSAVIQPNLVCRQTPTFPPFR
jgi:hypothetical protein